MYVHANTLVSIFMRCRCLCFNLINLTKIRPLFMLSHKGSGNSQLLNLFK